MQKRQNRRLRDLFPLSWKDTFYLLSVICTAAALCFLLRFLDDGDIYVSMIFLLAVVVISRITNGYFYGIISSILGMLCVNYIFTYPYFEFNFTISGYPVTFITMLMVSLITCTMTSQIKEQEKFRIAAEKEKMRGNLLRAVSHDLRTPLTSILGASAAILENDEALGSEKRKELLRDVQEDASWLIRMVENLLSITRIGEVDAKIVKQKEAVEEIVAEAVRKFKKRYANAEVSIAVSVPDELLMVPMDATLIEQVIINLLENAVRHGKTTSKIRLSVSKSMGQAIFEVRDNGQGIAESAFKTLFDGYFCHAEEDSGDNSRNMGIGLSVCNSIIQAHGGTMSAENCPEGGAKFCFTLPLGEEVASV